MSNWKHRRSVHSWLVAGLNSIDELFLALLQCVRQLGAGQCTCRLRRNLEILVGYVLTHRLVSTFHGRS